MADPKWEETEAVEPKWEDTTPSDEPSLGSKAKGYFESAVVDQLPALGAAGGGVAGGVAGSVPGALGGSALGGYLGKAAQNVYNRAFRPDQAPKDMAEVLSQPAEAGIQGAGVEALGQGVGAVASKALGPVAQAIKGGLAAQAEKLAEKSTGATGAQVYNKFPDNAGRELLDRGIVGFGDSQSGVANNARAAMDASRGDISSALKGLDARGGQVSRDEIKAAISARASGMKSPAKADVRRQLEGILEDVSRGPESYPLSEAEKVKREFQDKVNWANPDKNPGNAAASDVYRQAVEDRATALDPDLASKFTQGKKEYGLLAPITEAAEKRAATNAQRSSLSTHSLGTGSLGAILGGEEGYRHGGLKGGLAGAAIGATIGPRALSSGAVTADVVASLVARAPGALGKYAPVLAQAAANGNLPTIHKILESTDPAYRDQIKLAQDRTTANQGGR